MKSKQILIPFPLVLDSNLVVDFIPLSPTQVFISSRNELEELKV